MTFMGKRNQGKPVIIIMAIAISVALLGGSIFYAASGLVTGSSNNTSNNNNSNAYSEANYKQIIKAFQDQLKANPNDLKITENLATYGYFEFGNYYLKKGDNAKATEQFNLAIPEFQKVVQANPKNAQTLGDLATALFYTGKVDDAITTVNKAIAADPNLTTARANLGFYLGYGKGDFKGAIAELKKVPTSDPNYKNVKNMIDEFTKAQSAPAQSNQSNQLPTKK